MTITNKLVDECQRVLTTMENDAAFEVQRHTCEAFEPAIEARFVLRTRGNGHLNTTNGA